MRCKEITTGSSVCCAIQRLDAKVIYPAVAWYTTSQRLILWSVTEPLAGGNLRDIPIICLPLATDACPAMLLKKRCKFPPTYSHVEEQRRPLAMFSCAEATALWELLEDDPGKRDVQLMGQANTSFVQSQDEANWTSRTRWNQLQKLPVGLTAKVAAWGEVSATCPEETPATVVFAASCAKQQVQQEVQL